MLFLAFMFAILFLVSFGIESIFFNRLKFTTYIGIIPLVLILSIIMTYFIAMFQVEISKDRAEIIINSLQKYKLHNGKFPDKLDQLVQGILIKYQIHVWVSEKLTSITNITIMTSEFIFRILVEVLIHQVGIMCGEYPINELKELNFNK